MLITPIVALGFANVSSADHFDYGLVGRENHSETPRVPVNEGMLFAGDNRLIRVRLKDAYRRLIGELVLNQTHHGGFGHSRNVRDDSHNRPAEREVQRLRFYALRPARAKNTFHEAEQFHSV